MPPPPRSLLSFLAVLFSLFFFICLAGAKNLIKLSGQTVSLAPWVGGGSFFFTSSLLVFFPGRCKSKLQGRTISLVPSLLNEQGGDAADNRALEGSEVEPGTLCVADSPSMG